MSIHTTQDPTIDQIAPRRQSRAALILAVVLTVMLGIVAISWQIQSDKLTAQRDAAYADLKQAGADLQESSEQVQSLDARSREQQERLTHCAELVTVSQLQWKTSDFYLRALAQDDSIDGLITKIGLMNKSEPHLQRMVELVKDGGDRTIDELWESCDPAHMGV